ncbi:hypothetical protein Dda_2528 [Drechslerella dactyloides]|uniref:Uncharacterized protein n=1 Tax=Drechslerella dactyloides TaxID=74499 RepID=A0AAD6NKU8_DREDA|nr:hypothetical protein Dda_2528 [Drechslerella dactyloides]
MDTWTACGQEFSSQGCTLESADAERRRRRNAGTSAPFGPSKAAAATLAEHAVHLFWGENSVFKGALEKKLKTLAERVMPECGGWWAECGARARLRSSSRCTGVRMGGFGVVPVEPQGRSHTRQPPYGFFDA